MSALAATADVLSPADATAAATSREIDRFPPRTARAGGHPVRARSSAPALPARRHRRRVPPSCAASTPALPPTSPSGAHRRSPSTTAPSAARAAAPVKGSPVRMRDWCLLDVPGVLAWAARTYPNRPLHWVGHSMGGFATGLAHNNHLVARQLNVATLSGYWGRMAVPERYRVRLMMGGAAPLDRARARLHARPPDGRRGHARPGLPRVAALVHDARLPVRRCDACPSAATSPRLTRAAARAPDRRRPLGHGGRRRAHGRALHRQPASAPSGTLRLPRPASPRSATSASSAPTCATRCGSPPADWLLGDTGSDPMARPRPVA